MKEAAQPRTPESQLVHDVFNAIPIGIAVESLDGQPLFVNPAFCLFLGFSEEELRNKHCVDFSPPEDAEKDWALFQELKSGSIDHYQLEKRYYRKDGSLVWGSLSISLLNSLPSPLVIAMVEDITDKKRAEDSRLRLATVVESCNDAIVSKNLDGTIVSWNRGAEHIYGYTEAEAVGKPITILVPRELMDEEHKILERLGRGEHIEHYETDRVTKGGKKINVSLSISPIKDSSGTILGLCSISRDISHRKRAEEYQRLAEQELSRLNERLHVAIEAGSAGGWDFDLRTGTNVWFGKAHAQLGMRDDETLGSVAEFWARVHEEDRARLERALQISKEKHEEFVEDFRVVWRDGTTHWLRSRGRYHYGANGQPERMLGISLDITEQKVAQEALQSSERRYRLLFERNVAGVGIASLDGRLLDCNDGWAHILGYTSRDELRGHHVSEYYFNLAERQPLVDELFEKQVLFSRDLQLKRKDGTPVWVLFNCAVHSDHDRSILQATMIDISEWKSAEEALSGMTRKLIESLEQERARIGRELHDDINQRLALLSIEVEQLRDKPSEIATRLQEVRNRINQISSDVQGLSHDLHSSKLEYLGPILGMKSWCKEFAGRQKLEVDFKSSVSTALPLQTGLCLFRVLQEALQNAIKYSGVKRVEVQLREDCGQIHLIVSDSGKGFDVEAALKGNGLGLTSMRERVRLIGGTISIDSQPNGGTTIQVCVPLFSERVSHAAA